MPADTRSLSSMLNLDGRVAVVAGGAGAIGAAIGDRLRLSGATVFSLDRAGLVPPKGVTAIACDLTDPEAVTAALAHASQPDGRLDILVHAAGITRDGRLWKISPGDWDDVISTNLSSAYYLLRAAVPLMRRNGAGAVVFISSINGERAKVGISAYSASKAGLNSLTRTAAAELGPFGIRVNAIAPGWILSPMTAGLPDDLHERARGESPLGRLGEPDDVARAAVFLASELSRHITGQVLRVDGGQLMT